MKKVADFTSRTRFLHVGYFCTR